MAELRKFNKVRMVETRVPMLSLEMSEEEAVHLAAIGWRNCPSGSKLHKILQPVIDHCTDRINALPKYEPCPTIKHVLQEVK